MGLFVFLGVIPCEWLNDVLSFIIRRLLQFIPTMLGAVTLVFFLIALAPGDPARIMLGERAQKEQLEELREELGLNKPLIQRYGIYLVNVLQLDLGKSILTQRPVVEEMLELFPATIELSLVSIVLATFFGIGLGCLAAIKRNSTLDYVSMSGALVGVSMPVFWLGLMCIMLFSVILDIFPTGGRINARYFFFPITNFYFIDSIILLFQESDWSYLGSTLIHIVLPASVLATVPLAVIARTTRSSMLEVLKQDYIRTARSLGISTLRIIRVYALKNALLTIFTVIGVQFGLLLSSAILTETIFAWPGIGKWIYNGIAARDYPVVQGGVILIVGIFLIINLVVDVIYAIVDPRIRITRKHHE